MKLTPEQEQTVIEEFKKGTTATELRERYCTTKHAIATILARVGLVQPIMSILWKNEHVLLLHERATTTENTYTQLADELNERFGTNYSREAVCGKLHRMGVRKRSKPSTPRPVPERQTRFVAQRNSVPEYVPQELDESDALNVSLLELEDGMCKHLTGDAAYCGIATGSKRESLCPKHRAYNRRAVIEKPRSWYNGQRKRA